MRHLKSRGETLKFTAGTGGVVSGQPVLIGHIFGYVHNDAAEGESAILVIGTNEFPIPKETGVGESYEVGDYAFFDESEGKGTTDDDDGANLCVGVVTVAAGESDTRVFIKALPIALRAAAVLAPDVG